MTQKNQNSRPDGLSRRTLFAGAGAVAAEEALRRGLGLPSVGDEPRRSAAGQVLRAAAEAGDRPDVGPERARVNRLLAGYAADLGKRVFVAEEDASNARKGPNPLVREVFEHTGFAQISGARDGYTVEARYPIKRGVSTDPDYDAASYVRFSRAVVEDGANVEEALVMARGLDGNWTASWASSRSLPGHADQDGSPGQGGADYIGGDTEPIDQQYSSAMSDVVHNPAVGELVNETLHRLSPTYQPL